MNPLTWQNPGPLGSAACQSKSFLLLRYLKSLIYNSVTELRVLAEKKKTSKWLAAELKKDPATISKCCTNTAQPSLETLIEIAKVLEVDVRELIVPNDIQKVICRVRTERS